jgi:hypothetical protein
MGELRMYRVDDDGEHHNAIAESEQDALVVLVESGISDASSVDEYVRDYAPTLRERASGEFVTLVDDDGIKITRTAGEWVAKEGRGLFSSSVF